MFYEKEFSCITYIRASGREALQKSLNSEVLLLLGCSAQTTTFIYFNLSDNYLHVRHMFEVIYLGTNIDSN